MSEFTKGEGKSESAIEHYRNAWKEVTKKGGK
jgi:hypothetical protein